MKLGLDKAKVTCFKCKQKGHFKRECTNQQADDSVNLFHEDYYKKAIYDHINEHPSRTNQKQIGEGSLKEMKQALITIQEDEGFNWNKYIPKEKFALVPETIPSREERHARMRLSDVYEIFMEARRANRWDDERKCFIDPQGNLALDPQKVDFEALVAVIPTVGVWAAIYEDLNYRKEVEDGIKRVIYSSVEKKKTVVEIVNESKKMVDELKKTEEKANKENQEKFDEKLKSSVEEVVAC
ncbi:putative transcription factor interactor and regulator CCHC(Zn) family [Helianthus annuus]|nr:putative transcription factor interactor and regulator CCHC(Zn) family [Helianthus annuus]